VGEEVLVHPAESTEAALVELEHAAHGLQLGFEVLCGGLATGLAARLSALLSGLARLSATTTTTAAASATTATTTVTRLAGLSRHRLAALRLERLATLVRLPLLRLPALVRLRLLRLPTLVRLALLMRLASLVLLVASPVALVTLTEPLVALVALILLRLPALIRDRSGLRRLIGSARLRRGSGGVLSLRSRRGRRRRGDDRRRRGRRRRGDDHRRGGRRRRRCGDHGRGLRRRRRTRGLDHDGSRRRRSSLQRQLRGRFFGLLRAGALLRRLDDGRRGRRFDSGSGLATTGLLRSFGGLGSGGRSSGSRAGLLG
jgi:hypothetical protein